MSRVLKAIVKDRAYWIEEMKDKPCYLPACPFYDVCLNAGCPVKRFDCDKCFEEHKLADCIE